MNLLNVSSEHPIIFDGFQQKSDTFQIFWQKLDSFPMFLTKYDTFRTFFLKYDTFGRFCSKSLYFSEILGQNQILLKCFEQNFDIFRMIIIEFPPKYLKLMYYCYILFKNYRSSVQNIGKSSYFDQKYPKSIEFFSKTFEKYHIW